MTKREKIESIRSSVEGGVLRYGASKFRNTYVQGGYSPSMLCAQAGYPVENIRVNGPLPGNNLEIYTPDYFKEEPGTYVTIKQLFKFYNYRVARTSGGTLNIPQNPGVIPLENVRTITSQAHNYYLSQDQVEFALALYEGEVEEGPQLNLGQALNENVKVMLNGENIFEDAYAGYKKSIPFDATENNPYEMEISNPAFEVAGVFISQAGDHPEPSDTKSLLSTGTGNLDMESVDWVTLGGLTNSTVIIFAIKLIQ